MNLEGSSPEIPLVCARRNWRIKLAAVAILILGIGWLGMKVQTVRAEAKIAEAIGRLGGMAFFDEEADARPRSRVFPKLNGVAFYSRSQLEESDLSLMKEIRAFESCFLQMSMSAIRDSL
jgi:hypothetical protein